MRSFKNFPADDRGTVAIIFSFSLVILCALIGGAVDLASAHHIKVQLQAAVDGAALAGAGAGSHATDNVRISAATAYLTVNFAGATLKDVRVSGKSVSLSSARTVPTHFLGVIGIREIPVTVTASAVTSGSFCILLLNQSGIGLYVNSGSKLQAACGLHINSNHSTEALLANSLSQIETTGTCVHGAARLNSGSTATPAPVERCAIEPDPLLSLAEPNNAGASCDYTDFTVDSGQTRTMSPGVYCKKTLINSGGKAIMTAGVYVFRQGEFLVNTNSEVSGSEVMMYFADKDARLNINSDSLIDVSAPKSGTYQGVLMFQGRHSDNLSAPPFIINSDSRTRLEGTIYLPRGTLEVNSLSTANQSASYTAIVADKMVLNSFGTLKVNADYKASTPLPPLLAGAIASRSAWLTK